MNIGVVVLSLLFLCAPLVCMFPYSYTIRVYVTLLCYELQYGRPIQIPVKIIQFFIIYVVSQQPQGQLQT
jgi:hypothetical protein